MSWILTLYGQDAIKEYLLPSINNSNYLIHPGKRLISTVVNPEIALEVVDNSWRFLGSDSYRVLDSRTKEDYVGATLRDKDILSIQFGSGEKLSVLVTQSSEPLYVYSKYDISNIKDIFVGREEGNDIVYKGSNLVSRQSHAVFSKEGDFWIIEDRSENGLYINNVSVKSKRQLEFGDNINIFGLKIVFLGNCIAVNSSTGLVKINSAKLGGIKKTMFSPSDYSGNSDKIVFHRSPRQIYRPDSNPEEIEAPPQPQNQNQRPALLTIGPSLTMALPMLLGSGMTIMASRMGGATSGLYMMTGLVTALSSAVIGTVWAVSSMNYERKKAKADEEHRKEAYGKYLEKCTARIREKYDKNTGYMRRMYPDAAECCSFREDRPELWNRNSNHEDFLSYRLGLGDIPFQAPIEIPKTKFSLIDDEMAERPAAIKEMYSTLKDVPILIDLLTHKFIGIVGGTEGTGAREILYNIVAQAATSNCYTDLKMVFVYDEKDNENGNYDFVKWLPHVWSPDKKIRYVACGRNEASDVLYELTNTLRIRLENVDSSEKNVSVPKPYYILFVINPSLLDGEMITSYMGRTDSSLGLSTVMLVENYEDLPNGCNYIIEKDYSYSGMYQVTANLDERIPVRFDTVTRQQLEYLSGNLANIEVSETESGGEMPTSLTFFDMFGINRLDELNVLERWRKNRTYDSMRALVGQKGGGADCYLDVHEKYHGPHGLVAGTTGSGKSETLQTYILSLAINYSPDDIGFFLIDYKGGGMANLFDGLPHIIGQISNLSGNQVRRAMVSIKSENKRRQRVFNENGVNNINNYTKLYKNNEASLPVPHMFIVIDEFAELKREEPEFMKELISVAQVGRSLGVHLILATQKPAGTVDDNIWSNSRFRLCLRVQDRQDSNDMLHKPDAAYITQAGRAYLQVGNDELFELFQSGYSGAEYDPEGASSKEESVRLISTTGKTALAGGKKKKKKETAGINEKTQLDAVVEYLGKIAGENGYTHDLMLWLPVLPTELYLKELDGYRVRVSSSGWREAGVASKDFELKSFMGLYDDPVNQAQNPIEINFTKDGHHLLIGMAGTGKSTFVQTLVYNLICNYTPEELNLYMIDYSSKMAESFKKAPHMGGIVYEGEDERLAKLFTLMKQIIKERKKLFQGGNYAQYIRVNGITLPPILMVIDNFGSFRAKSQEMYDEDINQIIKEGVACGIYLIITAGGISMADIPSRMADNIKCCISLEMADKYQYADVMRSTYLEVIPEVNIKGRGLAKVNEQILEFQTALSIAADDDFSRMKKIEEIATAMSTMWSGRRARIIPEIPEKPVWNEFVELDEYKGMLGDDRLLPVGYDAENASVYGIDLSKVYTYIISGKKRTGKTNFLKCVAASASGKGGRMIYIDFGNDDLSKYAAKSGAEIIDNDQKLYDFFAELKPDFVKRNARKRECLEAGMTDEDIYMDMLQFTRIFVIIANIPDFINHMMFPEGNVAKMSDFVENILDRGRLHNVFWFGCLSLEDYSSAAGIPAYEHYIRDGVGIHFGGNVSDQMLLNFDYIPFSEQNKSMKNGIGMIPGLEDLADTSKVVVPLLK